MIEKKGKQIYIDGVPASDIGQLVAKHSQPKARIHLLNEVCRCMDCRRDKPLAAFEHYRENRKGYFGVCRECKAGRQPLSQASGM